MNTNVILDFICVIAIIIMIITILITSGRNKKRDNASKIFIAMVLSLMAILVFDILGWYLDKKIYNGSVAALYVVNTLYYVGQILFCWIWLSYVCVYVVRTKITFKRVAFYTVGVAVAEVVILLLNLKTHWVFYIDEVSCTYVRGDFYSHNLVTYYIYIFSAIALVVIETILSRDYYHKRKCISLGVYVFLPIVGAIIQSFTYGASLIWPFATLAIYMLFVSAQQEKLTNSQINESLEREKRVQLEKELVDKNVMIMLSQIRPHFLYNTLTAIAQLCDIDPKVAKQATIDFSKYLRVNIDSVSEVKLIPFETEFQHIEKYLALEKLRFEEDLKIVYDIKATGFLVPVLSIQPLVENAVKYGVCQKEDGGTVIIATREEKHHYKIIIKDNGVGFDLNEFEKDGKVHVGLENVRSRLMTMCEGTLEIESQIGVGTTVTVSIPKGE